MMESMQEYTAGASIILAALFVTLAIIGVLYIFWILVEDFYGSALFEYIDPIVDKIKSIFKK